MTKEIDLIRSLIKEVIVSEIGNMQKPTFTVPEFCTAHGNISKSFFYELVKQGQGPRLMKIRGRTLITAEAAAAWRAKMEAETNQDFVDE